MSHDMSEGHSSNWMWTVMLASASLRCRVVAARVVLTMLTLVPRDALLVRNPPARRGRRSPLVGGTNNVPQRMRVRLQKL
jgi:hypothetical protein